MPNQAEMIDELNRSVWNCVEFMRWYLPSPTSTTTTTTTTSTTSVDSFKISSFFILMALSVTRLGNFSLQHILLLSSPNFGQLSGLFWRMSIFKKIPLMFLFWATIGTFWILLLPSSGHTDGFNKKQAGPWHLFLCLNFVLEFGVICFAIFCVQLLLNDLLRYRVLTRRAVFISIEASKARSDGLRKKQ